MVRVAPQLREDSKISQKIINKKKQWFKNTGVPIVHGGDSGYSVIEQLKLISPQMYIDGELYNASVTHITIAGTYQNAIDDARLYAESNSRAGCIPFVILDWYKENQAWTEKYIRDGNIILPYLNEDERNDECYGEDAEFSYIILYKYCPASQPKSSVETKKRRAIF